MTLQALEYITRNQMARRNRRDIKEIIFISTLIGIMMGFGLAIWIMGELYAG